MKTILDIKFLKKCKQEQLIPTFAKCPFIYEKIQHQTETPHCTHYNRSYSNRSHNTNTDTRKC